MLASTAALFSSCTGKVDIEGYSIVYAEDASTTMINTATALAKKIEKVTGTTVSVLPENTTSAEDKNTCEILIGQLDRAESNKALGKIKGHGYYIGMIGKKIVLNGSTNYFALQALEAFTAEYFGDGATATFKVSKKVVDEVEVFQLSSSYTMVVSPQAYGQGSFAGGTPTLDKENTDLYDHARFLATNLQKKNASYLGSMKVVKDTEAAKDKEILIGRVMNRPDAVNFLSTLGVNDYGISISGDKIIVGAYSDTTLAMAMQEFADMLADSKAEDENGKKRIFLPASLEKKVTGNTNWELDFPRPTGNNLNLSGAADVADNSVQLYYTGAGVSATAYNSYCNSLTSAGYTLHSESGNMQGSQYRTYVNNAKGITLYVAYDAYTYATAQNVKEFEPAIRVISAPLSAVNIFDEEMLNGKTYTKKTETMITSVKLEGGTDENAGNLYVVTLEDGTFAVLDGGSGNTSKIASRLWDVLEDLYFKVNLEKPNQNKKIEIAMWYLTHGHGDHAAGFVQFCKTYKDKIDVKRVVTNFPGDYEVFNACDINLSVRDSFMKTLKDYFPGVVYYKVHTGQSFWLANSKFEVLYTHEDEYPYTAAYYNDSGVVMRQYIHANNVAIGGQVTPGTSTKVTSMLWLGDVQNRPSSWMRAQWGNYLKSDMVQVSHHGAMGCEFSFYQLTAPDILWWPTYRSSFQNCINPSKGGYYESVNSKIAAKGFADWIILGDGYNITVSITKAGPDLSINTSIGYTGTSLYSAGNNPQTLGKNYFTTLPTQYVIDKRN